MEGHNNKKSHVGKTTWLLVYETVITPLSSYSFKRYYS